MGELQLEDWEVVWVFSIARDGFCYGECRGRYSLSEIGETPDSSTGDRAELLLARASSKSITVS